MTVSKGTIEARVVGVPHIKADDADISGSHEAERLATAAYVAALTADLAALARQQKLETLGYLLDMARLEAEAAGRDPDG